MMTIACRGTINALSVPTILDHADCLQGTESLRTLTLSTNKMGQPDMIDKDGNINLRVYCVQPYKPIPTPPSSESESDGEGRDAESESEYVNTHLTNNIKTHNFYNVKFNFEIKSDSLLAHYPTIQRGPVQYLLDSFMYKLSRRKYFKSAQRVFRYWSNAMVSYQSVYEQLQFHKGAEMLDGSFNHLSAQIWMSTFILQQLVSSPSIAEITEDELTATSRLFANVIYEAMLTEEFLREFTAPLSRLTEIGMDLCRKMRHAMLLQQIHPHAIHNKKVKPGFQYEGDYVRNFEIEKDDLAMSDRFYSVSKEARAPNKADGTRTFNMAEFAMKNLVFKTNTMSKDEILHQLKIYLYSTCPSSAGAGLGQREWSPLATISSHLTLNLVNHILVDVTDSLTRLREKLLGPVLKLLIKGDDSDRSYQNSRNTSLLGNLNNMATFLLESTVRHIDFLVNDDKELVRTLRRGEAYLNQVIDGGREIMRQILEVLAMAQLCYTYLSDDTPAEIDSYDEIIASMLRKNDPNSEEPQFLYEVDQFHASDFFRTQYHEVCRRVPIVVRRAELILHKEAEPKP